MEHDCQALTVCLWPKKARELIHEVEVLDVRNKALECLLRSSAKVVGGNLNYNTRHGLILNLTTLWRIEVVGCLLEEGCRYPRPSVGMVQVDESGRTVHA